MLFRSLSSLFIHFLSLYLSGFSFYFNNIKIFQQYLSIKREYGRACQNILIKFPCVACACPTVTSSIFGKSFHFPFPYFVIIPMCFFLIIYFQREQTSIVQITYFKTCNATMESSNNRFSVLYSPLPNLHEISISLKISTKESRHILLPNLYLKVSPPSSQ